MIDTVVIPAAGQGTRMLPATKAIPKELLPVYDTPLLQFAIDEAVAAGARQIVIVSSPSKPALDVYLRRSTELEASLRRHGKATALADLKRATVDPALDITVVYQDRPLGLGHAVLQAEPCVETGMFGVILPDDLLLDGTCLREMGKSYADAGCRSLVAAVEVGADRVGNYGIFDVDEMSGGTVPARGMVEKPAPADAPSRLAAIGRYVLPRQVFDALNVALPGAGGEIQLTDAISAIGGLHAWKLREDRYDCGSKEGLFEACVAIRDRRLGSTRPVLRAAE